MFNLTSFIQTAGYLGIFALVFAESGLFVGFFLPGDSLLFTAGILASQHYLNIIWLAPMCFLAAASGDSFGYFFGKKIGKRIFTKEDSLLFHKNHIQRAQNFYESHGPKTIILARFMPIVRTFAPILAGVGAMRYSKFLTYNLIGAFIWGAGMPSLGYFLGTSVPNIDHYLLPIIVLIIIVSILPTIIHIVRDPQSRAQLIAFFRKNR